MGDGSSPPGGWLPPRPPDRGAGAAPVPAPERPLPPPAQQQQQPHGYPPPQQQQAPVFVRPPSSGSPGGLAIAALVCGIGGLALLLISAGLWFPLTIPVSAAAWVCGAIARRRIRTGLLPPDGAGMAKAGQVLGIVGIALGVVAAVVWIALIASGLDLENLLDDLRDELEQQRDQQRDSPGREVEEAAGAIANLPRP